MNWKCPNCNYSGTGFSLFDGLGQSLRGDYRCPKCLIVLDSKLQCPKGHRIVGQHELLDRVVPGLHILKAITGTKRTVCPECETAYPYPSAFKIILTCNEESTVNEPF